VGHPPIRPSHPLDIRLLFAYCAQRR
jgi:hypothetical protein